MAGSERRRILVGAETKGGGARAGVPLQLAGVEPKGGGAGAPFSWLGWRHREAEPEPFFSWLTDEEQPESGQSEVEAKFG
jgi:hypothetical protein